MGNSRGESLVVWCLGIDHPKVVREQCWLNETLLECDWTTDSVIIEADELPTDDDGTEADLEAILSGECLNITRARY